MERAACRARLSTFGRIFVLLGALLLAARLLLLPLRPARRRLVALTAVALALFLSHDEKTYQF